MALGPDGRIYLLRRDVDCNGVSCEVSMSLARRLPDGAPDRGYSEPLLFSHLAPSPSKPSLAVDGRGRVLVSVVESGAISLVRLSPDGSLDTSFGEGGRISVGCDCRESLASLRLDGSGHILLWGGRRETLGTYPGPLVSQAKVAVTRLSADGFPEPGFGQSGWLGTVVREGSAPSAFAPGPDGSVVLAGYNISLECCASPEGVYLVRLNSDGSVDEAFGAKAARGLQRLGLSDRDRPRSVTALIPLRRGALEAIGNSNAGGYVMRLRRDGSLDRRFGHEGLRPVNWHVDAVAPLGGGRLFAVGSRVSPYTGGAVVFALKADGGVAAAFSRTKRAIRLASWNPSQVTIGIQKKRRPLLFETGIQLCRSYCLSQPKLIRFDPIRK